MAYNNPFMNALQQGGSVANQSASVGSQFMRNSISSLNTAGSLSMKMIALLEQEEARKQQQLMQQTQLLHNIYQDAINTQLKQQQLQNQQEYQDNMLDLNKQKLDLEKKVTDVKLNALQQPQQPTYKPLTITDQYTGEKKIYFYNPKNPNQLYPANIQNNYQLKEPITVNNTVNKLETELRSIPYGYQRIFFNNKTLQGNTPIEKYSYFKRLVGNNIDPVKFIDTVYNNNYDKLKQMFVGSSNNSIINDGEFLAKLNNNQLLAINSINPNLYETIVNRAKEIAPQIIDMSLKTGEKDALQQTEDHYKQLFGKDFKKLGFDVLFNNLKQKFNNIQQNAIEPINQYSSSNINDTLGNTASWNPFGKFNKNTIQTAVASIGTPYMFNALMYLHNNKTSSIKLLGELFDSSKQRKLGDSIWDKSFFADKVLLNNLDPDIKKAVNEFNNVVQQNNSLSTAGSRVEQERKYVQMLNEFFKENPEARKNPLAYKDQLDEIRKKAYSEIDLQPYRQKIINIINQPKYKNLMNKTEKTIEQYVNYFRRLYPNKSVNDIYSQALDKTIQNLGLDNVRKAFLLNLILTKTMTEKLY